MTVAFAKFEVFCCCQGLIEKIDGYDRIWMARQMHRAMTYQLHRTIMIYVDNTLSLYFICLNEIWFCCSIIMAFSCLKMCYQFTICPCSGDVCNLLQLMFQEVTQGFINWNGTIPCFVSNFHLMIQVEQQLDIHINCYLRR